MTGAPALPATATVATVGRVLLRTRHGADPLGAIDPRSQTDPRSPTDPLAPTDPPSRTDPHTPAHISTTTEGHGR